MFIVELSKITVVMEKVHIKGIEDLTKENIDMFVKGLNEINKKFPNKQVLMENGDNISFNSLEDCMKYFDAVPFEEFDKKFKGDV